MSNLFQMFLSKYIQNKFETVFGRCSNIFQTVPKGFKTFHFIFQDCSKACWCLAIWKWFVIYVERFWQCRWGQCCQGSVFFSQQKFKKISKYSYENFLANSEILSLFFAKKMKFCHFFSQKSEILVKKWIFKVDFDLATPGGKRGGADKICSEMMTLKIVFDWFSKYNLKWFDICRDYLRYI